MIDDPIRYPCEVRCYRLVARDGKPPHPEDNPVARQIVTSREELEAAKVDMINEHPGCWLVEVPSS